MKILFITFLIGQLYLKALSQEIPEKLNSLRAPSISAANMLAINGNSIMTLSEKPKFETELGKVNKATSNFTVLPSAFAVSISPFQLIDKTKNVSLLKDLSLSVGYSNAEQIDLAKEEIKLDKIAYAFSWRVVNKRTIKNEKRSSYEEKFINQIKDIYKNNLINTQNMSDENERQFLINYELTIENILLTNREKVKKKKFDFFNGSAFDVSAAKSLKTNTIATDEIRGSNIGIWATASFFNTKEKEKNINDRGIIFMARYLKNLNESFEAKKDSVISNFDIGIKLFHNNQEFEDNDRFYLELEFVYRLLKLTDVAKQIGSAKEEKTKYKLNLQFGYQLMPNLVISANIGKDFGSATFNKEGNLFALLNLAGGIGSKK